MEYPDTNVPEYDFAGCHLVASYLSCDSASLLNAEKLLETMHLAITNCGATLLNSQCHVFENGGITAVMLLSESHASIHTYPEHAACFVDIFTCGTACDPRIFDETLRAYLSPAKVASQTIIRDRTIAFPQTEKLLSAHNEAAKLVKSNMSDAALVS